MAKINGKKWRIYVVDGTNKVIPLGTTDSLEISNGIIDASDKDSGGWQENIDGQRSWTASSTANYDASQTEQIALLDTLINTTVSTAQDILIGEDATAGDIAFTGKALIESASVSADNEAIVTVDFSFTGTGALTKVTKS